MQEYQLEKLNSNRANKYSYSYRGRSASRSYSRTCSRSYSRSKSRSYSRSHSRSKSKTYSSKSSRYNSPSPITDRLKYPSNKSYSTKYDKTSYMIKSSSRTTETKTEHDTYYSSSRRQRSLSRHRYKKSRSRTPEDRILQVKYRTYSKDNNYKSSKSENEKTKHIYLETGNRKETKITEDKKDYKSKSTREKEKSKSPVKKEKTKEKKSKHRDNEKIAEKRSSSSLMPTIPDDLGIKSRINKETSGTDSETIRKKKKKNSDSNTVDCKDILDAQVTRESTKERKKHKKSKKHKHKRKHNRSSSISKSNN